MTFTENYDGECSSKLQKILMPHYIQILRKREMGKIEKTD